MASRDAFLNHIAQRLGRTRGSKVPQPKWLRQPWDHLHQELDQEGLVQQFKNQLLALKGEVIRVTSEEHLPEVLLNWLSSSEGKKIVAWNHPSPLGQMVLQSLEQLDSSCDVTIWSEKGDSDSLILAAEQADIGIAIAEEGISETGSVVLYNRGNQGRLVSLLPPVFVCILPAQAIVPRITQVLQQLKQKSNDYSCINLITGPSRSADIEMDLSIGVHGPGRIIVFLVES
ncbi:LutC/YkgG family protein [Caldalkalibacillus mannanilyticus]|uniref:LutC/YkgG family protein n=1 Tax=Caldalkalibacillus mannanilyticus TaxID=1418 RepID=UPI000469582D|nr:lactate utilization protein C [Caldalkalibacillus mannanilyticus]